ALNQAGYKLAVDGDFGPKTEAAVIDFQKQNGLRQDGIAGSKTLGGLAAAQPQAAEQPATRLGLNKELSSPDSGLAVPIGVVEGNRNPNGTTTKNYEGHPDPKSGYNIGTFSYQGKASGPRQADAKQLEEFKRFQPKYEEACRKAGVDPGNPLLAGSAFDL